MLRLLSEGISPMVPTSRLTIDDLDAFPDPLDDTRYELIDGELYVTQQPHWAHQFAGASLGTALHLWSRQTRLGCANIAPSVIFSRYDVVAPDVLWISRERRAQGLRPDGKLYIAPEIAIEILSPGGTNEHRDRELKRKLYAREGVAEYWIVDWRIRQIAVYHRAGDTLELAATFTDDDTITSSLLPGFAFPVRDLWEPSLD